MVWISETPALMKLTIKHSLWYQITYFGSIGLRHEFSDMMPLHFKVFIHAKVPKFISVFYTESLHDYIWYGRKTLSLTAVLYSRACAIYGLWGFMGIPIKDIDFFYKSRLWFMGIYITRGLPTNPHKFMGTYGDLYHQRSTHKSP